MCLRVIHCALMALVLLATSNTASAQAAPQAPPADTASVSAAAPIDIATIAAGTPLVIEISEPLASSTHKRGDTFGITLAEPLQQAGIQLLAAGIHGRGEIIHAAPARGGGAPGELLIAARTLETPQGQLLLRGFKLGASGDDNSGAAIGASLGIGVFAMFIRGGEVVVPAGTRGIAKTKATPAVAANALPTVMPGASTEAAAVPVIESRKDGNAVAEPAVSPQPEPPAQPKE